jgi:hypothetical protein
MSEPSGGPQEPAEKLPEKGPDAARQFAELLEQARRLQRERGFSSKTGEEEGERPAD